MTGWHWLAMLAMAVISLDHTGHAILIPMAWYALRDRPGYTEYLTRLDERDRLVVLET